MCTSCDLDAGCLSVSVYHIGLHKEGVVQALEPMNGQRAAATHQLLYKSSMD